MRICVHFHKGEDARFISHLDVQRLVQRAMRRAALPLKYSQGFNPHPLVSFASALSVGYTSDAEWMDVRLEEYIEPAAFQARMNACLPHGLRVQNAVELDECLPTLTAMLQKAWYRVSISLYTPMHMQEIQKGLDAFVGSPIVVEKRTKGGMKAVDIRPYLLQLTISPSVSRDTMEPISFIELEVECILNASGGLNMELMMQALLRLLNVQAHYRVHRKAMEFDGIGVLPL